MSESTSMSNLSNTRLPSVCVNTRTLHKHKNTNHETFKGRQLNLVSINGRRVFLSHRTPMWSIYLRTPQLVSTESLVNHQITSVEKITNDNPGKRTFVTSHVPTSVGPGVRGSGVPGGEERCYSAQYREMSVKGVTKVEGPDFDGIIFLVSPRSREDQSCNSVDGTQSYQKSIN